MLNPIELGLVFSVQTLCSLCLCGESQAIVHHRDTEDTKDAQRRMEVGLFNEGFAGQLLRQQL